jgi:hypothetical protein
LVEEILWRDQTFYEMMGRDNIDTYVMKICCGGVIVIEVALTGTDTHVLWQGFGSKSFTTIENTVRVSKLFGVTVQAV